jgi:hypothetical protein
MLSMHPTQLSIRVNSRKTHDVQGAMGIWYYLLVEGSERTAVCIRRMHTPYIWRNRLHNKQLMGSDAHSELTKRQQIRLRDSVDERYIAIDGLAEVLHLPRPVTMHMVDRLPLWRRYLQVDIADDAPGRDKCTCPSLTLSGPTQRSSCVFESDTRKHLGPITRWHQRE